MLSAITVARDFDAGPSRASQMPRMISIVLEHRFHSVSKSQKPLDLVGDTLEVSGENWVNSFLAANNEVHMKCYTNRLIWRERKKGNLNTDFTMCK